ncbi:tyrosine-type recombinase/integrase [Aquamicrobium defluvii]|uniref:tyrosine-type recombinase/integrase n=1 Tax=Aquamicrobium defluvii TaxID=69279 RepID=UPI0006868AF2|nr:site-specific integrase [Aquamicrobium defluvii]
MCDARVWERPRKAKGTNVVRLVGKSRSGTSPVEYDYAARFVAAMSPDPAMLMTFLFYTGLRPIEAFALRAEDVDVDKQWFVVRSSKTGQPRGVPLHSFLCGWLPALVERGGALFRTPRGEPYGIVQDGGGGLKTAIKGARKRSGINDVSPYTARHTVSTALVVAGVHPHIKDQILGHAADDMSRHYTNVPQAPLIEAINKLPAAAFEKLPWVSAPAEWFGKLAEGTGKRNDLKKNQKRA